MKKIDIFRKANIAKYEFTMKNITPFLLFLLVSVTYSGDLPGLDSLNVGDKAEIIMIEKSIYSGDYDSTSIYIKLIERMINLNVQKCGYTAKKNRMP